ncbi:MAG: type II toxin-antitoxin system RelE/ParE family toxin [Rhodanobacteraceae bacterium]
MTCSLALVESALKEWRKLAPAIRDQLKNKSRERLEHPHVASARLHGMPNCCKIKSRTIGYRLVYQVDDRTVVVIVAAVGKRDRNLGYRSAKERM